MNHQQAYSLVLSWVSFKELFADLPSLRIFLARQLNAGKGCLVSIFNGQLGDTPALHGCTTYGFDDDVWSKMYYYPSRCLGKAVLEGTFENQPLPNLEKETNAIKENENQENEGEPEAKKSKLSKEQLENIRIGKKSFNNI